MDSSLARPSQTRNSFYSPGALPDRWKGRRTHLGGLLHQPAHAIFAQAHAHQARPVVNYRVQHRGAGRHLLDQARWFEATLCAVDVRGPGRSFGYNAPTRGRTTDSALNTFHGHWTFQTPSPSDRIDTAARRPADARTGPLAGKPHTRPPPQPSCNHRFPFRAGHATASTPPMPHNSSTRGSSFGEDRQDAGEEASTRGTPSRGD
jgi:hypothetical protein